MAWIVSLAVTLMGAEYLEELIEGVVPSMV
jgi:hypothetical protein